MSQAQSGVVVVTGPPRAGKTSVAQLIAEWTRGQYCSLTDLAETGQREGWLDPETTGTAASGAFPDPEARILTAALDHGTVTAGTTLTVLDDVISTSHALNVLAAAFPDPGSRVHVIELHAPEIHLASRAHVRSAADTHTFIDLLGQYKQCQPNLKTTARRHGIRWIWIDAARPPDICAAAAIKAIALTPQPAPGRPGRPPAPRAPTT